MGPDLASRIGAVLDQLAQAMKSGDLATAMRLTPALAEMSALAAAAHGSERQALGGLERRLAELRRLSSAALAGIQAARQRIEALRQGPAPLTTYDRSGHMAQVVPPLSTIERRS